MPTPLAGGLENSFAPQMIFLWPPARGVGKLNGQLCEEQGTDGTSKDILDVDKL